MKKFTKILKFVFVLALTLNMSVELMAQTVTINPPALSTTTILTGNSVNLTATRSGTFTGSGSNYTFTWTATGPATVNFATNTGSGSFRSTTAGPFNTPGDYYITCTVQRGSGTPVSAPSKKVTVLATAPTVPSIWATSSDGTTVSSFVVSNGTYFSGPTNLFTPTFSGTGGGSSTAALGLSDAQGQGANGTFYYLPNNYSSNQGVVTIYGRANNGTIAQVGTLDVNGTSNTNLGYVRLGMAPDGSGWILAGDGSSTVYLVKFVPSGTNGLGAATITVEDPSITLVGGNATDFFNGDLCVSGNGTIYALANSSNGSVTRIFKGTPNGTSTTFTKIFDLVDENGATFTGSVNGVAFDLAGSIYISTATGLYYVDANTVNTGSGTVGCFIVKSVAGLQDLASNVFPQQTTLPVIMSSFTVSKQGDNAMLNWKTATEINSDHFEIERSYDGVNFTKIGVKSAAGNSASDVSYQYTDAINYSYQIVYYRIKTVDADTKSSYSKIVPLRLNGGSIKDFAVFPNPFTSDIKLQVNSVSETIGVLRITNTLGQIVYNSNVSLQKGENILVVSEGLEKLNSGLMILELITSDSKVSQKIMKR